MKELHLKHYSTVNVSFKHDRMTAFSRHCHGKNATISRLLDIATCLLFLRTEAVNSTVFPILSAWQADLFFGHVHGAGKGCVVREQDGSFLQPPGLCCCCKNTFLGT